ncbi:hypothetical protein LJC58_07810 [Lachnospiraceae bacterium OttesenSCG-928-D06]|nr:hypothetical protein [Lachnospiraceae bacterium OttesenSCG-928-D06]
MSTIWVLSLVLFTVAIAAYYPTLFPNETTMISMAEMLKSPAMVGMMGPVYGGDTPTVAMLFSQEMSIWIYITVAVMNIFFVNRHTRGDEELGRLLMFRALPVGKFTGAASVMCSVVVLNGVIAVLSTIFVTAVHMDGSNLNGVFAYTLAIFGVGMFFAALTLFLAQLFHTSRGVTGAAFAVMGLSYILRGIGDIQDNALSFISPLGLGLRTFAFYENNFWCVAVLILESVIITIFAFLILRIRDHGEGIVPMRKGRLFASRFLRSPLGLAWRLTKNSALIWCAAVFVIGAMYGMLFSDIEEFVGQNEYYEQIISGGVDVAGSMIDNFAAFLFIIMALISVIPVIHIAGKIHAEEKRGWLEAVLVRGVSRTRMYGSYIFIGILEAVAVQFCAALGVFAPSKGLVVFEDMLKASFAYIPALLFMLGLVVFLVGLLPQLTSLIWVVYGYSAFAAIFLRLFDLPNWLCRLSPFGNVPQLPAEEFLVTPLLILTILATVLTALGMFGFSKRDIK